MNHRDILEIPGVLCGGWERVGGALDPFGLPTSSASCRSSILTNLFYTIGVSIKKRGGFLLLKKIKVINQSIKGNYSFQFIPTPNMESIGVTSL